MSRSSEFDWIERHLAPLAAKQAFGLKDDAALIQCGTDYDLVVTQDAILEGIHFLPDDPVETIAQKALRVNVSDIVAKGAQPFAYSMALGMPDAWQNLQMEQFAGGLRMDQDTYGLKLLGGDTYRSPDRLCVSVTMFGRVEPQNYKSRLGAKPGDVLMVSGTMGDGALGLQAATKDLVIASNAAKQLLDAYRLPRPPLAMATIIARHATASMDISDGLIGDCEKLCRASSVGATIEQNNVPLSPAVHEALETDPGLIENVLGGGDDYQTLSTFRPQDKEQVLAQAKAAAVQLTEIGEITRDTLEGVSLTRAGVPVSLQTTSYSHF